MCHFKNDIEAKISYLGKEINITLCDLLCKNNYQSHISKYINEIKHTPTDLNELIYPITALASAVLFQADFEEDEAKSNFLYSCYNELLNYSKTKLSEKFYIFADYLNLRY